MHSHPHSHTHTYTCTHMLTLTRTRSTYTHTHTHTHAHTQTHMHSCTHTCMHTHALTYTVTTHTQVYVCLSRVVRLLPSPPPNTHTHTHTHEKQLDYLWSRYCLWTVWNEVVLYHASVHLFSHSRVFAPRCAACQMPIAPQSVSCSAVWVGGGWGAGVGGEVGWWEVGGVG